jgi:signal transduction histidine kinase
MSNNQVTNISRESLEKELEELRHQLQEATDTIEAIRTGQIDALVVEGDNGHQLFTLKSADVSYRIFIEKMTEGAITLNRDGIILYCNSQFASIVRTPLSQVIGLAFEKFISPADINYYRDLFAKCWTQDCKGEVLITSGDQMTPVKLSLNTFQLDHETTLSILLTDLTAQKNTQKQLHESNLQLEAINHALEVSNDDLQQFASVASHDLQEPLRKIQVFSNLLKEKEADLKPESRKYLEKIIESARRMKTLILDILNYSRLSAIDSDFETVELNDLFKELLEDFELAIRDKKAKVFIGELPAVHVNRGQIRQVLQNIFSNSLKFCKPGIAPEIDITSKRLRDKSFNSAEDPAGDYVMLSIQDNGIGFDEKYVNNIFSLFERLHSKDKFEGTGIGLAIAKKIIDKHNGLITARSKEENGAEFHIILPGISDLA